jgi:hypothetical protein
MLISLCHSTTGYKAVDRSRCRWYVCCLCSCRLLSHLHLLFHPFCVDS